MPSTSTVQPATISGNESDAIARGSEEHSNIQMTHRYGAAALQGHLLFITLLDVILDMDGPSDTSLQAALTLKSDPKWHVLPIPIHL